MDVIAHLEKPRAELARREWKAEIRRKPARVVPHVRNPGRSRLNDEVVSDGEAFRWGWGHHLGSVAEMTGVAGRVMYVLCEVGE